MGIKYKYNAFTDKLDATQDITETIALNDLSDVTITSVADNDILAYDNTSGTWINQSAQEAGVLAIDGSNANTNIDIGSYNFTTTGLGTFGTGIINGHTYIQGDFANLSAAQANIQLSLRQNTTSTKELSLGFPSDQDYGLIQARDFGVAYKDLVLQPLGGDVWLLRDSEYLYFGAGKDLYIYHDGSNAYIENGTGTLHINWDAQGLDPIGYVEFFDQPVSIGDNDDGKHVIINRHAIEGDDYIDMYVNKSQQSIISASTELQIATANIFRINVASYTQTITPIRIAFDSTAMYWGAGQDALAQFTGTQFQIQSDVVTATDGLLLRGGTNGIAFNIGATEEMTLTATGLTVVDTVQGEQLTSTDDITLAGLLTNTLGAADTQGVTIDGNTNPNTTSGQSRTGLTLTSTVSAADNAVVQNVKGMDITATNSHVISGTPLLPNIANTAVNISMQTSAGHSANPTISLAETNKGFASTVTRGGTITATKSTINNHANNEVLTINPTFNNASGVYTLTNYGANISISSTPTLTLGTLTSDNYGQWVSISSNAAGTTTNYAFYVFQSTGGDTNWAFYNNDAAANNLLGKDNVKSYFGTGSDASIYFDASDLIINSENVTANDEVHFVGFDGVDFGSGFITTTGTGTFGEIIDNGLTASTMVKCNGSKQLTSATAGTDYDDYGDVWFGDGVDGDVTISSNTTLTRNMYYNTLTVDNGYTLNPNGWRIHVKGTLTNNGTIDRTGNNGNNASGATLGSGGSGGNNNDIGGGGAGGSGAAGSTGASQVGTIGTTTNGEGGTGGGGGASGSGDSGAGAAQGADVPPNIRRMRHLGIHFITGSFPGNLTGGCGGRGGGRGAGDTSPSNSSGAGGGGGGGGGIILIYASTLDNTSGTISANGGNGGNGGDAPVSGGNAGGGGTGGGGGGGVIYLMYKSLTAGTITVSGGTAGATPGNGTGTGTAGSVGNNGTDGNIIKVNLTTGVFD